MNAFLYDVVSLVVEPASLAALVLGGQCAEDRDGRRRALIELIRYCVRQARGQKCLEHYSALRYPAGVDPRPILEEEYRLVSENDSDDWTPTEESRKRNMFKALDRKFYKTVVDQYLVPDKLAAVSLRDLVYEIVEIYLGYDLAANYVVWSEQCSLRKIWKSASEIWKFCPLGHKRAR